MTKRKNLETIAKLILINGKLYEQEREKEISRYRFSAQTLRKISGRKVIRQSFLDDLQDELAEIGWYLIRFENEYAVIDINKISSWVKLSSKRLVENNIIDLEGDQLDLIFDEKFPYEPMENNED